MKPELKQFGNLTQADFERVPIWVGVHTIDSEEPWYDETDEETFRPWTGGMPVNPKIGMFLVRAEFTLADKSNYSGFITPVAGRGKISNSEMGTAQPHLFLDSDRFITFWGGMLGFNDEAKTKTYEILNRTQKTIFPIRFKADRGLAKGRQQGKIFGFYKLISLKTGQVEISV
jgi:hypothetical protein